MIDYRILKESVEMQKFNNYNIPNKWVIHVKNSRGRL